MSVSKYRIKELFQEAIIMVQASLRKGYNNGPSKSQKRVVAIQVARNVRLTIF